MRKVLRSAVTTWTCLGGVLQMPGAAIAMLTSLMCAPTLAHHSVAEFDVSKELALSGVVREFEWANPHSYVQLLVADEAGRTVEWSLVAAPPNVAARAGWTKDSLKAGDKVTLLVHPALKTGSHRGELISATFPNGDVLSMRPPGLPPPPPP